MKKIVFFNYAHRGDVFFSRAFVDQIINELKPLGVQFYYAHYWGEYLLKDIELEFISLDQIPNVQPQNEHASNFTQGDTIYINTWIGKYFSHSKPRYGQCNLQSIYHLMYFEIFNYISNCLNISLQLKDILYYFPVLDYSKFDIESIDKFIQVENRKKVLFCNGPALSGQCEYNGDMLEIVEHLAEKYTDIIFIVTHKIHLELENVKYTGDIIKVESSDLNEISYLSTFCDIIVGRSSGPFTFANVKENIFDDNKSFLCFGERETDCSPYELNIPCEFIFQKFTIGSKLNEIADTIVELIEK